MTFITGLFSAIPKWVWVALVATLGATSCKLTVDLGSVKLELEKSKTTIAQLETDREKVSKDAALQTAALSQQVVKAQNESRKREAVILADAAAANAALDGLRKSVSTYGLRASGLPTPAIAVPSDPVPQLLLQCAERYSILATEADGWVNEVILLREAWPAGDSK